MRKSLIGILAVTGLTLAACGGSDSVSDTTAAAGGSGNECTTGKTLAEGTLTIGTGNPAFSPWVENDAPESGEGFEAAVAYAVATAMGFDNANVAWVRTSFDEAVNQERKISTSTCSSTPSPKSASKQFRSATRTTPPTKQLSDTPTRLQLEQQQLKH